MHAAEKEQVGVFWLGYEETLCFQLQLTFYAELQCAWVLYAQKFSNPNTNTVHGFFDLLLFEI